MMVLDKLRKVETVATIGAAMLIIQMIAMNGDEFSDDFTLLYIAVVFICLALFSSILVGVAMIVVNIWAYKNGITSNWLFAIGGVVLLILSAVPKGINYWIAFIWLKFAEILGMVMPKILLGLVFFLFLAPFSFLFRLFNKDALQLKKKKGGSYYTDRDLTYEPKHIENIW